MAGQKDGRIEWICLPLDERFMIYNDCYWLSTGRLKAVTSESWQGWFSGLSETNPNRALLISKVWISTGYPNDFIVLAIERDF